MKGIIIGGGIAGLTAHIALHQAGIETEVYEAAPELKPIGAGIWLASNAMQLFDKMGLAVELSRSSMMLDQVMITDEKLKPLSRMDQQPIKEKFGFGIHAIHRGRLQEILLNQCQPGAIHTGKAFNRLREEKDQLQVWFKDGTGAEGDFLIGADGINSDVRKLLHPTSRLSYSGQTCWRGVTKMELTDEWKRQTVEAWGRNVRFGFSEIGEGMVYWFAVKAAPGKGTDHLAELKGKLRKMFKGFSDPIPALIEATKEADIIRSDLVDLYPMKKWNRDNICLIGDAAHPMTPNLGQGGAQAVEDAWYLTQSLKLQSDPAAAFESFASKRKKKLAEIVLGSRSLGKLAHLPYLRGVRNWMMRLSPDSSNSKQWDKLFKLE